MIKKLLEKHKLNKEEKLRNKPIYKLGDLYVGEIVYIKDRTYKSNDTVTHLYTLIKEEAIFLNEGYGEYKHIKSKQTLRELFWTDTGAYEVTNLKPIASSKAMAYLLEKGYTKNSKLSINEIVQLEDALQAGRLDNISADKIFK